MERAKTITKSKIQKHQIHSDFHCQGTLKPYLFLFDLGKFCFSRKPKLVLRFCDNHQPIRYALWPLGMALTEQVHIMLPK
jgi:hypothetical protein